MEYFGAWETLIHEKKLRSKILCQTPFNYFIKIPVDRGKCLIYIVFVLSRFRIRQVYGETFLDYDVGRL